MIKPDFFINDAISIMLQTRLPNKIQDVCVQNNLVLAGGAITSLVNKTNVSDYDLFATSTASFVQAKVAFTQLLKTNSGVVSPFDEEKLFHETANAISFTYKDLKFQLVKKLVPTEDTLAEDEFISQLLSQFDFTVCMCAYVFKSKRLYYDEHFIWDNISKVLVFNPNVKYPICSLYRTQKYMKKGYKLSGVELTKLALAINRLTIESYADLKEQLQGIDTLVFEALTNDLINEHGETASIDYDVFSKELMEKALNFMMKEGEE